MNKEVLRQIIVDQKEEMEKSISAASIIERAGLDQCSTMIKNPNILLITGMRRAGKSVFAHLLSRRSTYCFLSFDDERLIEFKSEHFQQLVEVFQELYGETDYYLFDEIQNISGWELFVNRIRIHKRIIVTGSNSNLMSSEMGTHLTGRFDVWQLFPMSFNEFLTYKKHSYTSVKILSTVKKSAIKVIFDEFLKLGGVFEGHIFGPQRLRTLFSAILAKDILMRHQVRYPVVLEELALILFNSFAQKISFKKIAARCEVQSSHTIAQYTSYLESTFLVFLVRKFSYRIKEQQAALKKVYCIDNGLLAAMTMLFSPNKGQFLENLVAIELKKRESLGLGEIFYWDNYRQECDFVIKIGSKISCAYQVCYFFNNENSKRELDGLCAALDYFKLTEGTILTDDQDSEIKQDTFTIHLLPVWKWLLLGKNE
jgi:predicted AAA+ superfamily ATPase